VIELPRMTVIKLDKYREWTEELGDDREGFIQIKQAEIYRVLQEYLWSKDCFALPLRYDYYIALTNGLSREDLITLKERVGAYAPYGLKIASVTHKYPAIAQLIATKHLASGEDVVYMDGVEDENVVLHIDLNNITEYTDQTSLYESYIEILMLNYNIARAIYELGGLANYLGGDNLLAILPKDHYKELIEILPSNLKIGVGVSINPRKALKLASQALTRIRRGEVDKNYLILYDS